METASPEQPELEGEHSTHTGDKSTWNQGGLQRCLRLRAPKVRQLWHLRGGRHTLSCFYELVLPRRAASDGQNKEPRRVGGHVGHLCAEPPSPWQAALWQGSGCMATAGRGGKGGWEEPHTSTPWKGPPAFPRSLSTPSKTYLVPTQLTFKMSDVMVFRGISRGSCMCTSCSSARIQGKSWGGSEGEEVAGVGPWTALPLLSAPSAGVLRIRGLWGASESPGKHRFPGSSTGQDGRVGQSWAGNPSNLISPKHRFWNW